MDKYTHVQVEKTKKHQKAGTLHMWVFLPDTESSLGWSKMRKKKKVKKKLFPSIIQPTCEKEQKLVNQANHVQCE